MIMVRTVSLSRFKLSGAIALGSAVLSGCAFRLPVFNVPSQQRLVIVGRSPECYVVCVQASEIGEFPVAADDRVTIDVPRLPRACSVYLFDRIRISRGVQPLSTKAIHLIGSGNLLAKRISPNCPSTPLGTTF